MSQSPENTELSSDVLAKLVHDLKAPLRHIVSFAELLGEGEPLSEEQQEYLGFIQSGAENLGVELANLVQVLRSTVEQVELSSDTLQFSDDHSAPLDEPELLISVDSTDNYCFAKVLFVEDSLEDATLFKRHCKGIEGYDWEIDHVQSYDTACKAIEDESYDLYFFDYYLGDGTGLDLVSVLKNQKEHGPVLIITGVEDADIGERALITGATGYAPKQQLSPNLIYQTVRHAHIRRQAELKLEDKACIDGLTGAFNRSHFTQLAGMELSRAKRFAYATSLIMLDIDNFKTINDQHGHLKGDHVIMELVHIARAELRSSDILGRFGGDEFVVLMPQSDSRSVYEAAERLRAAIETGSKSADSECPAFTVSIGVATDSTTTLELPELIQSADSALYLAKELGRNQVASA